MNEDFVILEDHDGSISTSIDGVAVYFTHNKRRSKFFAWRAAFNSRVSLEGYGETVDDALIDLWQAVRSSGGA